MLVDFETAYVMNKEWAETLLAISEDKESSGNLTMEDTLDIIINRVKATILMHGDFL